MKHSPLMNTILAALGGLLGAALLLGILSVANGGEGFVSCTGTTPVGWAVPLIGGVAIALASISLLGSGDDKRSYDEPPAHSSACMSCGSPILDEWRLCPYCGQMLECRTEVTWGSSVEPGVQG